MLTTILGATLGAALIASPAAADPVTFTGLGPVTLGMTQAQAIATGAMAKDRALCPSRYTADFLPAYEARTVWNRRGKVIGIMAERAIRGIKRGSSAVKVKREFPKGSVVGTDIYLSAPIYAVTRSGNSLQFLLKKGKVRRITLTTGWVSRGGEWTC